MYGRCTFIVCVCLSCSALNTSGAEENLNHLSTPNVQHYACLQQAFNNYLLNKFFLIDSLGTRILWSLVHHPFIQLARPKTWNHSWPFSLFTPHIWPMNKLCLYYLQNTFLNSWLLSTSTVSSLTQDTLSPWNYSKCPLIIYHFHSHHAISQGPEWVSCSSAQNLPGVSYLTHCKSQRPYKERQNLDGYLSLLFTLFQPHWPSRCSSKYKQAPISELLPLLFPLPWIVICKNSLGSNLFFIQISTIHHSKI